MAGRSHRARRLVIALAILVAAVALSLLGAGLWARGRIRASLPALDGEVPLHGLASTVTIERDARGVPTLHAVDELDLARGTGFAHAQDRFFQMDLARRAAAGELAALAGRAALEADRRVRVHRFRSRARVAFERSTERGRLLLEAYTEGVNAGLSALAERPFEYLLLRVEPRPWLPEDSILVLMAMFLDLQDEQGRAESRLGLMRDLLPAPLFDFLTPAGTEWDAPLDGSTLDTPPLPGAKVIDLRRMQPWSTLGDDASPRNPNEPGFSRGSNNWAVSGKRTSHGGAMLANDMHLGLAMPNIWYRASLSWKDPSGRPLRVTGVTLPGVPGVVAGSNGHVAWGFTNSYGDWSDLVELETNPDDPDRYRTPDGWRLIERYEETLLVNTCAAALTCEGVIEGETLEVRETIWGPIVDRDHRGRPRALRWVAHDPEAVNIRTLELSSAGTIDEAMAAANRSGIPAQNLVVADRSGRIGWTIMGVLPRRSGCDGRFPGSWADAPCWDGWLAPEAYPRLVDPADGLIWTANARVAGTDYVETIGDGGFALGARARQIRDGLRPLGDVTERDLLAVQLDDRARFLERWRNLLLDLLDAKALEDHPNRGDFRRLIEETWTGHASIDSNAYRFVRAFRVFLSAEVFGTITLPCREADPGFEYDHRQSEGPLWTLVQERPPNLLHPAYESWRGWMLAVVDDVIDYYLQDGGTLEERTWGQRNTVKISHPLSLAAPALGRWLGLDLPREPLPGDRDMPRVQGRSSGASQRMVVAPGRERHGIFHMPGGQSGNPASPFYSAGHRDWAEGRPSPFLPGPTAHTLRLIPPE